MDEHPALDGDELMAALTSAGLDTDDAVRVQVADTDEYAWVIPIGDDWFAEWERARSVVHTTGRWPVVTIDPWGLAVGEEGPSDYRHCFRATAGRGGSLELRPRDILAAAEEHDVDSTLRAWQSHYPIGVDELDRLCQMASEHAGRELSVSQLIDGLGPTWDNDDVYEWLHQWDIRTGTPVTRWETHITDWVDPSDETMILALLPAASPWAVPAYLSEYDDDRPDPYVRTALFRSWSQAFGIEPVLQWATMHNLLVRRPPRTLAEAYRVTRHLMKLWPSSCWFPNLAAHDLVGQERWFLHNHP